MHGKNINGEIVKLDLSNILLCCIDDVDAARAIKVLNHCNSLCKFSESICLTSKDVETKSNIKIIKTAPIGSVEDYDNFIALNLLDHLKDYSFSHIIIVQHDGFILNPNGWSTKFLSFDFLGSPSDDIGGPPLTEGRVRFMNSGFCLLSKHFLNSLKILIDSRKLTNFFPLDGMISGIITSNGVNIRSELENLNVVYGTGEIASQFSIEYGKYKGSFGYHSRGFEQINDFSLSSLRKHTKFLTKKKEPEPEPEVPDIPVEFFQIGYKEEQRSKTLEKFKFILNSPNSIFQEHSCIVRNIKESLDVDWIGFFPYRVRDKLGNHIDYNHCMQMIDKHIDSDVLTHANLNDGNAGVHDPRCIHPNMWHIFDKIMVRLGFLKSGSVAFGSPCRIIYTSSFIGRKDFLLKYKQEMLAPMMNLMECDDEIYHLSREPSDYGFPLPDELRQTSGLNHWTHVPFLLERALTFYIQVKNAKLSFCL